MLAKKFNQKGLSLLESLIILAIIALLAIIVIFVIQNTKENSRDEKRKTDLKQISEALTIYFAGAGHKKFPIQETFTCIDDPKINAIQDLVLTNVMKKLPQDPLSGKDQHCYYYMSDGKDYKLGAEMENDFKIMEKDGGISDLLYEVYTPGARNWP